MILLFLRSVIYTGFLFFSAVVASLWVVMARPFGYDASLLGARAWGHANFWALRVICNLDYRIEGLEHLPRDRAVICFMKHSSAWEAFAQTAVFPGQAWVLKRELMWVPILGWALWALDSIHIDRNAGHNAVRQVIEQGKQKLAQGHWVMIFPEGTRMPPGTTRRYGVSGSLLARDTNTPILPVAHNAGDFWGRNALLKHPGVVTMRIGPLIEPRGRNAVAINEEVQDWIESQMKQISPGYPGTFLDRKKS